MNESATRTSIRAGRIYDELNAAILSGRMLPGEKLSEPAIASHYGISRAPVREAIRRLQERGLVTHVANQGARVTAPTLEEFLALLDCREAMEGMAARLAATAMSAEEIRLLEEIVEEHGRSLSRDPSGPYLQDAPETDFHVRLALGCRNPVLSGLLCDQFYPRLKLCRRQHGAVKGRGLEAWKEHRRILGAIVERDGEMAEILMRRHIRAAKHALQEAYGGDKSNAA